jgi:hypothetical protein
MGHIHDQSPDAHTGTSHGAETSYYPPTLVDNPGSGQPPNACFHTPLTTVETESHGSDLAEAAPNLPIHEAYRISKDTRSAHIDHQSVTPPTTTGDTKEGTPLLKFIYGHLYNGKLAKRYEHAPTDECPLCHHPDSCTRIAGERDAHKNLSINRHNAACRLIQAAIRNSA